MRHGGFRECVNFECVNFNFGSFEFACAIGQLRQEKQSQHSKLTLAISRPMLLYRTIALFSMPELAISTDSEQKPC
jgi:hypothetical protein